MYERIQRNRRVYERIRMVKMLNIEKYRARLENYDKSLDCDIQNIREKYKGKNNFCGSKTCDECRKENMQWLLEEYKEQILDDVEKKYLSAVIKPFRDKVKYMLKNSFNEEFISIVLEDKERREYFNFPYFKKGTMYQGMEANKRYTLEELGL